MALKSKGLFSLITFILKFEFWVKTIAKKVIINKNKSHDKRSYKVSFSLFKKLAPQHQPKMNFKKSVLELAKFLKKHKKSLKNFRNSPKWSRLSRLNYLVSKRYINKELYKKYD